MIRESFQPDARETENRTTETAPSATDSLRQEHEETVLGECVSFCGELSGEEDVLIDGKLEGSLRFQEHRVTVGPHGQVKADIHARQVVVQGSVTGNIAAKEKIEIRRTGEVLGGLVAAGIAIEDGAYLKGSVEILREKLGKPLPTISTSKNRKRKKKDKGEIGQSSGGS